MNSTQQTSDKKQDSSEDRALSVPLTKIVATVGPNVLHEKAITKMIQSGVRVFRFNLKHNTLEWHNKGIQLVNRVADELDIPVSTMIDLQGPSIRVNMPKDEIVLHEDEKIYFGDRVFDDEVKGISVTHPDIIESLEDGQIIKADDGRFSFTFKRQELSSQKHDTEESSSPAYLITHTNGVLLNKKNVNIPGADFTMSILVDKDLQGIQSIVKEEVDYVALSFVRTADDIIELRKELEHYKLDAHVIAKIETKKALDNIEEIVQETDAVMVARGDLGVEVPFEEVPFFQKELISMCIKYAKPVITATQMLNTMIKEPEPTRAEISDVANAVYDLTDAVMLSGETATGSYPFRAVRVMNRVARYSEKKLTNDIRLTQDLIIADDEARICDMAYNLYTSFMPEQKDNFAGFVAFTKTGRTARLMARYRTRPDVPIYALTHTKKVQDKLAMSYGVIPIRFPGIKSEGDVHKHDIIDVLEFMKKQHIISVGQQMIVLYGDVWAQEGGTSTVKLVNIT